MKKLLLLISIILLLNMTTMSLLPPAFAYGGDNRDELFAKARAASSQWMSLFFAMEMSGGNAVLETQIRAAELQLVDALLDLEALALSATSTLSKCMSEDGQPLLNELYLVQYFIYPEDYDNPEKYSSKSPSTLGYSEVATLEDALEFASSLSCSAPCNCGCKPSMCRLVPSQIKVIVHM
jgi:hypothetical protein